MQIQLSCSACRNELTAGGDSIGRHTTCPHCRTPVFVPRSGFAPKTRIAGFEIIRLLGKGGMGEVYLAHQTSMDRNVALKILPQEFASQQGAVDRFLKEVRVAAKLDHTHIVAAHDAGEDDGLYYMAMSYVPGQSLAAMLEPGGVLNERDALEMTKKLAQALDYAWGRFHIIHRDIKPANILFDDDGEPKLADMGLSKSVDEVEGMTMAGMVMGTPNYMSPEQAEGADAVDFRADMYSLGATLYHAVTGHMPFHGSSIMDVLRKQAVETLPDPRRFNPKLSEHCVALLQIMLAKNPADRYANWKALIHDIDRVLAAQAPSVSIPAEGQSVLISKEHAQNAASLRATVAPATPSALAEKPRSPVFIYVVTVLTVALVAAGFMALYIKQQTDAREQRARLEAQRVAEEREQAALNKAREQAELWQVAEDFAKANPPSFDRAIANFKDVGERLAGTKYELMAKNEIEQLRTARAAALSTAFAELETRAKELADRKDYEAAAGVFEQYSGAFAEELADRRARAGATYRTHARELAEKLTQAEREGKAREQATIAAVAAAIFDGDLDRAQKACRTFLADETMRVDKSTVTRIAGWLDQAAGADKKLLASFEAQRGREVLMTSGAEKIPARIAGVQGDKISLELRKGVGWVAWELTPAQIPLDERQVRLRGMLDPAAAGIWNGMMLLRAQRQDLATEAFKTTGELATLLLAKTESSKVREREAAAQTAYAQLLQAAGLSETITDPAAITGRIQPGVFSVTQAGLVLRKMDAYKAAYGDTTQAKEREQLLLALRSALESAQKGVVAPAPVESSPADIAATEHGSRPVVDAFTKRVIMARTRMGEVIRCSPEGGKGTLRCEEAVKKLKRGSVLVLTEGTYRDIIPIEVSGVVIEGDGIIKMLEEGWLRVDVGDVVVRGLKGFVKIMLTGSPRDRAPLVMDSGEVRLMLGKSSHVDVFNSLVNIAIADKTASAFLRHCTIAVQRPLGGINTPGALQVEDSVITVGDHVFGVLNDRVNTVDIQCRRSLLLGKLLTVIRREGADVVFSNEKLSHKALLLEDCVIDDISFPLDPAFRTRRVDVGDQSAGRGIAAGGRDPGALQDDWGRVLPLDPIPSDKMTPAQRPSDGPGFRPFPGKGFRFRQVPLP